jgi:hypothetical protein
MDEALHDCKAKPRGAIDCIPHRKTGRLPIRYEGGLQWYRGKHAGQIDAILALQKMGHSRIATKLQKHFGMDEKGNIRF